jgi:hypothetical protein
MHAFQRVRGQVAAFAAAHLAALVCVLVCFLAVNVSFVCLHRAAFPKHAGASDVLRCPPQPMEQEPRCFTIGAQHPVELVSIEPFFARRR